MYVCEQRVLQIAASRFYLSTLGNNAVWHDTAMSWRKIHQTSSFGVSQKYFLATPAGAWLTDPDTAAFSGSRFPNQMVDEVKRRRLKVESIDSDHVEVELLVSGLCTMAAVIPVSLADGVVGSMVGMGPVQMGVKIICLVDFLLGAYRVWCFFRCLGR